MHIMFYVCSTLLAIKLLWNLSIPIVITFLWTPEKRKSKGVELAPVEFLLLIAISVISFFYEDMAVFGVKGISMFVIGLIIIVFTYVYIFMFLKLFKDRFR